MSPTPAFETTRLLSRSNSSLGSQSEREWLRRMLSENRNNSSFVGDMINNLTGNNEPPAEVDDPEFRNQVLANVDAMGGTSTVGQFTVDPQSLMNASYQSLDNEDRPEALLVSEEAIPTTLTPAQMGRKELYTEIPFTALHGMQSTERAVTEAFLTYTAELDLAAQDDKTDSERLRRAKQTTMIIEEELTVDASVVTLPLAIAVLTAAASQFIVGYNVAVMSAPERFVFPGHTTQSWAVAVASFAIGGPFGALLGGSLADSKGRRGTLIIDMWTFFIGGLIQTFANTLTTVTIGRFIIGIASGISTVLVPVYLGELAPPKLRGMIGTLNQFAAVVGVLFADILAFPFANSWGWRYTFGLTVLISTVQIVVVPYVVESPRWLLSKDQKSVTARYILKQLRGLREDSEVESELATYMIGEAAQHQKQSQSAIVAEMFKDPTVRNLLLSCFALHVTQMFSGINGVFFYCGQIMSSFIDNPLIGMTLIGTVNLVSTYAALLLMDRCGRKTLILWSAGGMFASCCVIVLAQLGYLGNLFALVAVNTYVAFFEIGLGPIPWLYVAEVFEGKYVAAAMSVCSQLNWVCNFIVGLIFPTLTLTLGPYAFVPFAVVLAMGFVFTVVAIPGCDVDTPDTEELVEEMYERNADVIKYEPNLEEADDIDREWTKALEQQEHRRAHSNMIPLPAVFEGEAA